MKANVKLTVSLTEVELDDTLTPARIGGINFDLETDVDCSPEEHERLLNNINTAMEQALGIEERIAAPVASKPRLKIDDYQGLTTHDAATEYARVCRDLDNEPEENAMARLMLIQRKERLERLFTPEELETGIAH